MTLRSPLLSCALALVAAGIGPVAAASAQTVEPATAILTLDRALDLAGTVSPDVQAADAALRAASAARDVARLRPNPSLNTDFENVGGSRAYDSIEAPKQTVSVGLPVELGGKRSARIAVATAMGERAQIDRTAAGAELRLLVTQAYIEAVAADRRLATAREQAGIADEGLRAAHIRVIAGSASPLEEQRAQLVSVTAKAAVDRASRLAALSRANLGRRIGRPITAALDQAWFDRVNTLGLSGRPAGGLAVAAARADQRTAEAQVQLARSQRIPDVTVSAGVRRLPVNNDLAAVFGVSMPLPLFNTGKAAVSQAAAERDRADALRRSAELENDQAIDRAVTDVANAADSARTAAGPALAAATEAARIARIGYREGKFGQLDLLEAERTLAETRAAAIDALAAYHDAQARLERLTAAAPEPAKDN